MKELLFHTPWWLPASLIFVGVVLFWTGNRNGEGRVRNTGLLVLLAAILLMAVSYFVDTPLERAVRQSKALVASVQQRDWNRMKSILDPHTSVTVLNSFDVYNNRDQILAGAQDAVDHFGLKNVLITSTEATQADT